MHQSVSARDDEQDARSRSAGGQRSMSTTKIDNAATSAGIRRCAACEHNRRSAGCEECGRAGGGARPAAGSCDSRRSSGEGEPRRSGILQQARRVREEGARRMLEEDGCGRKWEVEATVAVGRRRGQQQRVCVHCECAVCMKASRSVQERALCAPVPCVRLCLSPACAGTISPALPRPSLRFAALAWVWVGQWLRL